MCVVIYAKIISRIAFKNMQRNQFNCEQSSSIVSQMMMIMMMMTITRCNRLSCNYLVAWIPFSIDCQFHPFNSKCVCVHSRTFYVRCERKQKKIEFETEETKYTISSVNTVAVFFGYFCRFQMWKWCNVTTAISG